MCPDAEKDDIDRRGGEQCAVAGAFGLRVGSVAVKIFNQAKWQTAKDTLAQEVAEPLRGGGVKADILIHMEGLYPRPVNAWGLAERFEKFVLGGRGRKDNADFFLRGQQGAQQVGAILCGCRAHGGTGFIDMDAQRVLLETANGLHGNFLLSAACGLTP